MIFSTGPHFDHHSTTRRGIPDDTWSCTVFTYDSSDKAWTFYLNGHVTGEGTYYRGQRGTSDPVTIGGWFEGAQAPSSMFSGSLDDISIYQRTLSPADAAAYCANDPLHWGQAVSGLVTPVPTLIRPTLIPVTVTSTAGPSDDCSNGWSRLTAGGQAVIPSEGHANGLRTDPVPADNILVVLYPGTVLHVLEGPVCSMVYVLWKVEATVEGRAMTGWIIEGDGFEYDLEPYQP